MDAAGSSHGVVSSGVGCGRCHGGSASVSLSIIVPVVFKGYTMLQNIRVNVLRVFFCVVTDLDCHRLVRALGRSLMVSGG